MCQPCDPMTRWEARLLVCSSGQGMGQGTLCLDLRRVPDMLPLGFRVCH